MNITLSNGKTHYIYMAMFNSYLYMRLPEGPRACKSNINVDCIIRCMYTYIILVGLG